MAHLRQQHRLAAYCAVVLVPVLAICCAQRSASRLERLKAKGYCLIEIGGLGRIRTVTLSGDTAAIRVPPTYVLSGVSESGELLVVHRRSPQMSTGDDLLIRTVEGTVVHHVRPDVLGIAIRQADFSRHRELLLFCGAITKARHNVVYGLFTLSVDGTVTTVLSTGEPYTPTSAGWSPKGDSIVFDHKGAVYVYDIDNKTSRIVAEGDSPSWSPDGRALAFRAPDKGGMVLDVSSSQAHRVLEAGLVAASLRWSPDGRGMLYTDAQTGRLMLLDLTDGDRDSIPSYPGQYTDTRLRWMRNCSEFVTGF